MFGKVSVMCSCVPRELGRSSWNRGSLMYLLSPWLIAGACDASDRLRPMQPSFAPSPSYLAEPALLPSPPQCSTRHGVGTFAFLPWAAPHKGLRRDCEILRRICARCRLVCAHRSKACRRASIRAPDPLSVYAIHLSCYILVYTDREPVPRGRKLHHDGAKVAGACA